MKTNRPPIFKVAALFVLAVFLLGPGASFAELPCWNDALRASAHGGFDFPPAAPKGSPNPQGSEHAADPVNVATGNYYYEHTDLTIPLRGLIIEFRRFYNNQDAYDGPFAVGWSHSYNIFLIEASSDEDSYVIRRNPDGSKDRFTKNPDGSYTSSKGVFDTLVKDAQGYLITDKHGTTYRFNQTGYLASISDRNNNSLSLTYDPTTSTLTKISDSLGRFISLAYNPQNKISTITDFTGRIWKYDYLDNNLQCFTSPLTENYPAGLTTTYAYQGHNLTSITDPKGNSYLNITYDSQNRVEKMAYGFANYDFTYSGGLTTVLDRKANRIDYFLNDDGTTKKKIAFAKPLNLETLYEYNPDKLITKVTYPKGNSVAYEYSPKGSLTKLTQKPKPGSADPDIITGFTYEPQFNFIKTITDPLNRTTTYNYDSKGNLKEILYPQIDNQTPKSSFTYNSFGQFETAASPNNTITRYEYYPDTGYPHKVIADFGETEDKLNLTTEYSYNALGSISAVTDPKGCTTSFEYDSHNNLTKTTLPAPFNYIAKYAYDENDNLVRIDKQTDDPDHSWQTTAYTYTILDELNTVQDPLGNTTTILYDANGNRRQTIDGEANSTVYDYDERNLLTKVTDAEGNSTNYAYDENSNLKQLQDAKANSTVYTYDDFDRLIKITYPDNSTESYTYDASSNLRTKTDPAKHIITYYYDSLNRLDYKTYPDSSRVDYAYDLASRLTDIVDSTGSIHYDYDSLDRIAKVTYPGNKTVSYEYDANSNRKKLTYPDQGFITYEYDQLNRLTYIKGQDSSTIAHYTYDSLSRRKQLDYANNTQTAYAYDLANRLTQVSLRGGAVGADEAIYTYDNAANRKTLTTASGITTYTYDKTYQLKTADYPENSLLKDTTYNYDPAGNITSTVEGATTTTYTPNSLNQYTQVNTANYTYDSNANLTNDGTNTYTYDYENRLTQASNSTLQTTYTYDPLGRRIQQANSLTGKQANYLYDADQIIAEYDANNNLIAKYIFGPGIDEPICKIVTVTGGGLSLFYYHFDGLGSVTNLTDSTGALKESYTYDAYGNPSATSNLANPFMFTGREYDPETGLCYYRARHYSPKLGRFLQRDPVGYAAGVNLYAYCDNNPISFIDPTGLDKQRGLLWYDRLAIWASYNLQDAQMMVLDGVTTNAVDVYSATILNTLMEYGMGTFTFPSALGHLGEGTGTFSANPSWETASGMLMDVSLTAGILATTGAQLNTRYYRYTGSSSKPTYNAQGQVNKGTWLTRTKYPSFSEAESKLQIPFKSRPINNIAEVRVSWTKYIGGPNKVSGNPQWGEGGGTEYRVGGL